MKFLFTVIIALLFVQCTTTPKQQDTILTKNWDEIVAASKGGTVTMMMYMGDKKANAYMNNFVIPNLKTQYDITLKIAAGQGNAIVSALMAEKEAGTNVGQIDLCWINGETTYQLKQINGLYGPYNDKLPNSKYIDYNDPIIKYDFQEAINGYETPWGKAFYSIITDSAVTKNTPTNLPAFETYWQQNPGKFTLSLDFMGVTLLKTWLIELAGGSNNLDGKFNAVKYEKLSKQLWDLLNKNKKYFWKNGTTFPESNVAITQMYSSGELAFAFSFGMATIDRNVLEGLFKPTSKFTILAPGCIHNANYIAIPYNAPNKAAALVVCNYLISPEAQIEKSSNNSWGSATILDIEKLNNIDKAKYIALPKLKFALPEAEVKSKSIKELAPTYMIKLAEDFRKFVIEKP